MNFAGWRKFIGLLSYESKEYISVFELSVVPSDASTADRCCN